MYAKGKFHTAFLDFMYFVGIDKKAVLGGAYKSGSICYMHSYALSDIWIIN